MCIRDRVLAGVGLSAVVSPMIVPFSTFQNWFFPIQPDRSFPLKRSMVFCADREASPRQQIMKQDERAFLYFIKVEYDNFNGADYAQTGKSI